MLGGTTKRYGNITENEIRSNVNLNFRRIIMNKKYFENLFRIGESIQSGGERESFEILDFSNICIRIKPIHADTKQSLNYEKIKLIVNNIDKVDKRSISQSVRNILKKYSLTETASETYLYGLAKEILLRQDNILLDHNLIKFETKQLKKLPRTRKEQIELLKRQISTTRTRLSTSEIRVRNAKAILLIKQLRGNQCQICKTAILKKDGGFYVEGAHIKNKSADGPESIDNIIVLCPNHHKEFDYGNRKIISHTSDEIKFTLNSETYTISLKV